MSGPRILLLDIETFPDVVYVWGVYEQSAISVQKHWQLASYSAEWYDTKKILTRGLCDIKGYKAGDDDRALAQEVWFLLDEADIVVAHNGADFDLRKMTARFIALGMTPPKPYKIVDTRKEVARVAAFSSNKLDWLCKQLEIGRKIQHEGWDMWEGCMRGEKKWWDKMKRYNRHDVELLRELYTTLAPWIRQPNTGVYNEGLVCPNPSCGSRHLNARGLQRNKTRVYQRYQCQECGAWARAVKSEKGQKAQLVGLDPHSRP